MSDADYITAQTLIRLNRSGNCCEILMSDPVCSDQVIALSTLKRRATLFQWKIHGVVFKVLDRDNKPSSFQEMLKNSTKYCLK